MTAATSHASPDPTVDALAAGLLARRRAFKAFLVARIGNEADAEDLLQNALVKALAHADLLDRKETIVAWFYRVLRNAAIDHLRSRAATQARDHAWAAEAGTLIDEENKRQLCRCIEELLPTLKPSQAELLRRVELRGEPVAQAARALGLTANNASVTLHRGRSALRGKLVEFCGQCAAGACLDCGCDETPRVSAA